MRIAVYETGHEIADTVAKSLARGLPSYLIGPSKEPLPYVDGHIAYGILRGAGDIFKACEKYNKPWFNVDRGYFNPGHYDGYYRISYRGTQARYDAAFDAPERGIEMEPKRKYEKSKPILVCPPTAPVAEFFGLLGRIWPYPANSIIRHKGEGGFINWDDYSAVYTFNSSVGWQALQRGIPCLSDPTHSVVGSYYATKSIDECIELFHSLPRKPLFNFMRAHQFTLDEIRRGDAWKLINHYLSSSGTTPVNQ